LLLRAFEAGTMVVTDKIRGRAELRKKPRRQFQYTARIVADPATPPRPCAISDISDGGARLVLNSEADLPEQFVLLLTKEGNARRKCRVVWRSGSIIGVEFMGVQQ
jgi:hypothetical protein